MSNLSLPTLTFDALRAYILKGRSHYSRTVANNTEARLNGTGTEVTIYHHGSTIATLTAHSITVTNAGYGSASTRERVNGVLSSNQTGFYVAQRQGAQVLFNRYADTATAGNHARVSDHFHSATFDLTDYARLTHVNGEPARILLSV